MSKKQTDPTSDTQSTNFIVDENDDGLDDRLIRVTIPTNENMQDIIRRLDLLQLRTLPEKTLLKMLSDLESSQMELLKKARSLERFVHKKLIEGSFGTLQEMRKELRFLNKEYEDLQEQRDKIFNALQSHRLTKNIHNKIGAKAANFMEVTILILIVVVLGLLFYDLGVDRSPDHPLNTWVIFYIDAACCIVFMSEFIFRLSQSDDKKWFIKNNWIDFVTSIPIPPTEGARLIRIGRVSRFARFLRVLRLLRLVRFIYFFWRGMDKLNDLLDVKMMKKSLKWGVFVILLGAFFMYKVEGEMSPANSGIDSFVLSLWWSFTTVVTGGFGDIYNPNSLMGQALTGTLVVAGMILIGVFTATLTSLYVGEETDEINHISDQISSQLDEIRNELLTRIDAQQKQIDKLLNKKET
jgi:voltage-gated potassium channel